MIVSEMELITVDDGGLYGVCEDMLEEMHQFKLTLVSAKRLGRFLEDCLETKTCIL